MTTHQQLVNEARATVDALRQRMAETYLADPMKGTPAYRRAQRAYYKADSRFYRRLRLRDTQPAAAGSEAWQAEQAGEWLAANEATAAADPMCPHCGNGIISEDDAGADWWHCDHCGHKAHEDEFYPAGARVEPVEDTRAAAFNQGWDAYHNAMQGGYDGPPCNPYDPGTSEHNFWRDGWTVAGEQAGEFEAD